MYLNGNYIYASHDKTKMQSTKIVIMEQLYYNNGHQGVVSSIHFVNFFAKPQDQWG